MKPIDKARKQAIRQEIREDMMYCIICLLLSIVILLACLLDVLYVIPRGVSIIVINACTIVFWVVFWTSNRKRHQK